MAKINRLKNKIANNVEVVGDSEINLDTGDIKTLPLAAAEGTEHQKDFWTFNWPEELTPTDELKKDVWEYSMIGTPMGYYYAEFNYKNKEISFVQISNFTIKILYLIFKGKSSIRVVELKNHKGKTKVLDIETKQLSSFGLFKEFTEGLGNFRFWGKENHLQLIKGKLFEEELDSEYLETLGWQKDGFFAYCNGIVTPQAFLEIDKNGIVTFNKKNYYIPFIQNQDDFSFQNEKRFKFTKNEVTFSDWANLYHKAFGKVGMTTLVYSCACIFSDYIYHVKNNFPMLFLYGEGGSGKSTVINFVQSLFGLPQPPLKLSEKANTDKSKIRKLAQFVNSIACLEEFVNTLEMSVIKTLTGIYDRFGYERSTLNSKFGTETVPISSGVIITGNEYPNDDPLLQRLILMDYNANTRTDEVVKAYQELKDMTENGITNVTKELIQYRKDIVENFKDVYRDEFSKLKVFAADFNTTDRMVENCAVLLAVFNILKNKIIFPFAYDDLRSFLIETLKVQGEKRDTGSVIQRFWDIVLNMINKGIIENKREFFIDGDKIKIRFKELHMLYMEEHQKVFRQPGYSNATLLQKLKESSAFVEYQNISRFGNGSESSSCHVFDYHKIGVDLNFAIEYKKRKHQDYANMHNTETAENVSKKLEESLHAKNDINYEEQLGF